MKQAHVCGSENIDRKFLNFDWLNGFIYMETYIEKVLLRVRLEDWCHSYICAIIMELKLGGD